MRFGPPWWFCCGWWSPWCVIDHFAHIVFTPRIEAGEDMPGPFAWICDRHDAKMTGAFDDVDG